MKSSLYCPLILFLFVCVTEPLLVHSQQQTVPDAQLAGESQRRTGSSAAAKDQDEVIKVDTDLVTFDVVARDNGGQLVTNLTEADFKLYDEGVERPIAFFGLEKRGGEPRPVAVVFALDVSGSMTADEILRLKGALSAFAEGLGDRDSVFAVTSFGMSAKTIQGFTSDRRKLVRAVERLAKEENGLSTHTYDAVDDAIRLLVKQAPRTRNRRLMKRAVIVVTDGFPVGDTVSPATVIERANNADVSIYSVTLPSYSRMLASTERAPLPTPLDVSGLTDRTGGRNVYATERDFGPIFRAIAEEVLSTYVIAFYPPEEKRRDGRFHNVRIEGPGRLTLQQSRPGYKGGER
jgi:VWFA-related protein